MSNIIKAETPAYSGDLTISVTSSLGFIPVDNATITISYSGDPDSVVQTLTTDDSGQTATISLPAPNLSYSTEISEVQPYSEYNISVTAPGYEPVFISGHRDSPRCHGSAACQHESARSRTSRGNRGGYRDPRPYIIWRVPAENT